MSKPTLTVVAPNGHHSRVELNEFPFRIGRHHENNLVLQDSRTSRNHAQIVSENGTIFIEDSGSRHGVFVNGHRIQKHRLKNSDRVEFGVPDSYQLLFTPQGAELSHLVESTDLTDNEVPVGANLARLKAVLEIARTLESSYSLDDVLDAVVDAALAVTGAERGFLFLSDGRELKMRCSRDCRCKTLAEESLRVPRRVLAQALQSRQELLSMSFEPPGPESDPTNSIASLELRSVVCVPLVRLISAPKAEPGEAHISPAASETAGVLYMDSRFKTQDMAAGNRELLQALAIEASVIIENARLLEAERGKKKIEEELSLARGIQQGLLPQSLPQTGWFRASGSSVPSMQVGGDYFDIVEVNEACWALLVADVSGKGMSSALVASVLQGAFITMAEGSGFMQEKMGRVNHFLSARTEAGKYATLFHATLNREGSLRYINAGHCSPMLVREGERVHYLETTGMPVGLIEEAEFHVEEVRLQAADKVVIYSDGVTDAQDLSGAYFGRRKLRDVIEAHRNTSASQLHDAIQAEIRKFTEGAEQADDITLVVLEYQPV